MTRLRVTAPSSNYAWKDIESYLGSRIVEIENLAYATGGESWRCIGENGGVWYVGSNIPRIVAQGYSSLSNIQKILVDAPVGGRQEDFMYNSVSYDMAQQKAYVYTTNGSNSIKFYSSPESSLQDTVNEQRKKIERLENAVAESLMDAVRTIPVTPVKKKNKEASRKVYWNRVANKKKNA